jgi:hypothetical protein
MNRQTSAFNVLVLLWHVIAMLILVFACVSVCLPSGMNSIRLSEAMWLLLIEAPRLPFGAPVLGVALAVAFTWLLSIQLRLPSPLSRRLPPPIILLTGILGTVFLTPKEPWSFPVETLRRPFSMAFGTMPEFDWSEAPELAGVALGLWTLLWLVLEVRELMRKAPTTPPTVFSSRADAG